MKKLLLLVLIGLLIALSVFIGMNGFAIGNIEVLGIKGIQNKSNELDEKIQEASKLAEKEYRQAVTTVEENAKKLEQEKKEYEEMTAISTEGDIQLASQLERYEVETLWVKLGNYATSEGAVMRMDIVKDANNAQDNYNLKFTVNGSYISITDFISDIENDSTLGFKIEEFKMLPTSNDGELQATFVCKDVAIKDVTETSNTATEEAVTENNTDENTTENTTNTNSTKTNTTNTNSTNTNSTKTNTTNTTNTSNSGNTAE